MLGWYAGALIWLSGALSTALTSIGIELLRFHAERLWLWAVAALVSAGAIGAIGIAAAVVTIKADGPVDDLEKTS